MAELEPRIVDALRDVYDPCCQEKGISVVDMGLVRSASVTADGNARVELLLTSGWCPFAARVVGDVRERVENVTGLVGAEIEIVWDEPWTTDRISEKGREALKSSGFAPPPTGKMPARGNLIQLLPVAECPYCGSRKTLMENAFGPTLCRAIYYCRDCRQPFEQFKQV